MGSAAAEAPANKRAKAQAGTARKAIAFVAHGEIWVEELNRFAGVVNFRPETINVVDPLTNGRTQFIRTEVTQRACLRASHLDELFHRVFSFLCFDIKLSHAPFVTGCRVSIALCLAVK